jgi:excisionase family DNA binding protein
MRNTKQAEPMMTPGQIARDLGLSAQTVLNFIHDGSLAAVNVARRGSRRPRYAVRFDDLGQFLVDRRVSIRDGEMQMLRPIGRNTECGGKR